MQPSTPRGRLSIIIHDFIPDCYAEGLPKDSYSKNHMSYESQWYLIKIYVFEDNEYIYIKTEKIQASYSVKEHT